MNLAVFSWKIRERSDAWLTAMHWTRRIAGDHGGIRRLGPRFSSAPGRIALPVADPGALPARRGPRDRVRFQPSLVAQSPGAAVAVVLFQRGRFGRRGLSGRVCGDRFVIARLAGSGQRAVLSGGLKQIQARVPRRLTPPTRLRTVDAPGSSSARKRGVCSRM